MNKTILFSTVIVAAAGIGAIFIFQPKPTSPKMTIDITDQPTLNAGAPISIVAFEDLKCSNCKRYSTELYPKIKEAYIDTKKASYTQITLAFLPGSKPAGNAALCLYHQDPAYFFAFVDNVYQHQPNEALDWATPATLISFASGISGVDTELFQSCMQGGVYNTTLDANFALASQVMGDYVETPTLFINGHKVNSLDMDSVEAMVKQEA